MPKIGLTCASLNTTCCQFWQHSTGYNTTCCQFWQQGYRMDKIPANGHFFRHHRAAFMPARMPTLRDHVRLYLHARRANVSGFCARTRLTHTGRNTSGCSFPHAVRARVPRRVIPLSVATRMREVGAPQTRLVEPNLTNRSASVIVFSSGRPQWSAESGGSFTRIPPLYRRLRYGKLRGVSPSGERSARLARQHG